MPVAIRKQSANVQVPRRHHNSRHSESHWKWPLLAEKPFRSLMLPVDDGERYAGSVLVVLNAFLPELLVHFFRHSPPWTLDVFVDSGWKMMFTLSSNFVLLPFPWSTVTRMNRPSQIKQSPVEQLAKLGSFIDAVL